MNKISYIIMSLLFFNVMFLFFYYFKICDFFYLDLFNIGYLKELLLSNAFVIFFDIIFMYFYDLFRMDKLSYFMIVILGVLLGGSVALLVLKLNYKTSDYLAIVSYFVINVVFLAYSLYFEKNKVNIFI